MIGIELDAQLQHVLQQALNKFEHLSKMILVSMTSHCRGTIMNIKHIHLQKRKFSPSTVPDNLRAEQKLKRLNICEQNLSMFEEKKWRLCDVITGDESRIYHRIIQKKAMNSTWVGEGETLGTVVKRNQFEPKSMICVIFLKQLDLC